MLSSVQTLQLKRLLQCGWSSSSPILLEKRVAQRLLQPLVRKGMLLFDVTYSALDIHFPVFFAHMTTKLANVTLKTMVLPDWTDKYEIVT